MTPFQKILNKFCENEFISEGSPKIKGSNFEKICLYFLRHDPLYKSRFDNVWLWNDWPGNQGKPDTGIDIVAKFKDSQELCAVQCKCYRPDLSISKEDIDSFLAASGAKGFVERLIFSTTSKYGKNAKTTLKNQQVKCQCLSPEVFELSKIDWEQFDINSLDTIHYLPPKNLRPYQAQAINKIIEGFKNFQRGKLIMACGTGKTFTALKLVEKFFAQKKGLIVFFVPSINLISQTLFAWNSDHDSKINFLFSAVCSDDTVNKKKSNDDDSIEIDLAELAIPPTTNAQDLVSAWKKILDEQKNNSLTVIFSTYQSSKVIAQAQDLGLPKFDLMICDEAHRTTKKIYKEKDSNETEFLRVHDNKNINADYRLYMTATPRIYRAPSEKNLDDKNVTLASMDNENIFGPVFYELSFAEAIREGILSDYKVMVLAIPEFKRKNQNEKNITPDEQAKIVGCWQGLQKKVFTEEDKEAILFDEKKMKTAIAFTNTIKNSQLFAQVFAPVIQDQFHLDSSPCEVHHVDGTMSMSDRGQEISWLKEASSEHYSGPCRILSNARCLSEGVDVPALDAILFMNSKKSKVDIIQSVGRVMRKPKDGHKKFGYVILPVFIPHGVTPEVVLDNSDAYHGVWDILQAMRSDDTLDIDIQTAKFNGNSDKIITGVVKIFDDDKKRKDNDSEQNDSEQYEIPFSPEDWHEIVFAQLVKKCGQTDYWDRWARDMAECAKAYTAQINALVIKEHKGIKEIFRRYLTGLRDNVNPNISASEAVNMLAQHMITKPVFDSIFNEFSKYNPISKTLEEVVDLLEHFGLKKNPALEKFYSRVKERFAGIKTDQGRQEVIKDLYERFFSNAFPATAARLGIVYTPIEVVDFILNSADWALKNLLRVPEGLSSRSVNILDPFTGTGTFIVRLIQSGLIKPEDLEYKYTHNIYACEILLLAYYIAAVNIESAFHEKIFNPNPSGPVSFTPFPGIIFTDTFKTSIEFQRLLPFDVFEANINRVNELREKNITVIIGNPPYSVSKANVNYDDLDARIRDTYAVKSSATLKASLYDSYIRAIRWASDKIQDDGLICYVTNGSFIDSNGADGLRKCFYEEFQSIYIFNLRGNAYTQGKLRKKEGGNVFGSGSRLPVAITLMVKDSTRKGQECQLYYRGVDDYMTSEQKFGLVSHENSFGDMLKEMTRITPNEQGDWINQRNEIFETFYRLGNKKEDSPAIFEELYSAGVKTNRDAWAYNFSREALAQNMRAMIDVYNQDRKNYNAKVKDGEKEKIEDFVTLDPEKISWDGTLYDSAAKNNALKFSEAAIRPSLYRPYQKSWLYFDRDLNNRVYRMYNLFPTPESENRVIYIPGIGSKKNFSVLMTDCIPDIQLNFNGQGFPLYWYEEPEEHKQGSLFEPAGPRYVKHDAISDEAYKNFRLHYHDMKMTKEDIFYYIYGVLSSPRYANEYGEEVKKMLARVPYEEDFWKYSKAGRKLGELHVNYESAEPWPVEYNHEAKDFRVKKLKLLKKDKNSKPYGIFYNDEITISNIPPEAWEYIVNGKSALEWIAERYQDSNDKASGLRNDCNAWGIEHGNEKYILELIARVVRVSVESVKIMKEL